MKPTEQDLLKLLRLLDITEAREIDCTEFMHRAAGFVETMHAGAEIGEEHADVIHHLEICPECLEEYRALYRALRDDC